MATTGSPLNLPLMSDSEILPYTTYNAAMAILNGSVLVDERLASEESITTTATMDATDYGLMHVITGTTADYTITLPTPVTADLGKVMAFRVSNAGTKVYTLDAAGSETIDGVTSLVLRKDDVIYLKAVSTTGNTWQTVVRSVPEVHQPWVAWTPTWTNATVGNGVVAAAYKRIGKSVICRLSFILGTTSAISGSVTFTLPLTSATYPGTIGAPLGPCRFFDTSGAVVIHGQTVRASTTTGLVAPDLASGTYVSSTVTSSTVPFTWATGDEITTQFFYEAA